MDVSKDTYLSVCLFSNSLSLACHSHDGTTVIFHTLHLYSGRKRENGRRFCQKYVLHKDTLLLHHIGQNWITWPPLVARESKNFSSPSSIERQGAKALWMLFVQVIYNVMFIIGVSLKNVLVHVQLIKSHIEHI